MEHILIPHKRVELLDDKTLKDLRERLGCKIELQENEVVIEGDSYAEYNAKNVLQAFGRGFDLDKAYRLLDEEYFFQQINLKDIYKNKEQMMRVKARIIGKEGKAKEYIESISGVYIAVFGSTISTIGKIDELKVADVALRILVDGGMHKTAYRVMENEKRKMSGGVSA